MPVDAVLSSIALSDLVLSLDPAPPDDIVEAAQRLRYRSLCLVALMIDHEEPFPDNWIYLHDPASAPAASRTSAPGAPTWSCPATTCLGVEYFCFEGDEMWDMPDEEAVALATDGAGAHRPARPGAT